MHEPGVQVWQVRQVRRDGTEGKLPVTSRPPEFDEKTVKLRFDYFAEGKCECTGCKVHEGHCTATFTYDERGTADDDGAWQADHFDPNGNDTAMNCRILCVPCHKATPTYGAHD